MKKYIKPIIISIVILTLASTAIYTAFRLTRTQSTAPQKSSAQTADTQLEPCDLLAFTIQAATTSPTATPTDSPTTEPTGTPTPTPEGTNPPGSTPPTSTPTPSLPEAGISLPAILGISVGSFLIFGALLLVL
ncbi:hypothetical protein A2382_04880 [Candidatus Woesebacteria bacterium RIFOXYB1_FULL_38_16]|uniref:Uncharacterized protein n=1 Tax=Candidatus Woesebacteria bacterium RIFOXYB1_FULL_38_16 TaxID=1802538 RepID=A0A1F8CUN2_9BACT|nr:MAG: hypothetical protein A2191_00285 [Candidatus Woesebacteria bacterium RIFOXYA1_FULL_38_9]OGM79992.1 MAG: hypothetical protein A2382_04880 [Candidatus Woesebacteria bacterium RIFOXYB1_FULL_38_16]